MAAARPVAGADGVVGGVHAAIDGLAAPHALRPSRRAAGSGRDGRPPRSRSPAPLRPRITARSPEAKLSLRLAAARRSGLDGDRRLRAWATPAAPPAR